MPPFLDSLRCLLVLLVPFPPLPGWGGPVGSSHGFLSLSHSLISLNCPAVSNTISADHSQIHISNPHLSWTLNCLVAISTLISNRHLQVSPKLIFGSFPGEKKNKHSSYSLHLLDCWQLHVLSCSGLKPQSALLLFPQPHHQFIWHPVDYTLKIYPESDHPHYYHCSILGTALRVILWNIKHIPYSEPFISPKTL